MHGKPEDIASNIVVGNPSQPPKDTKISAQQYADKTSSRFISPVKTTNLSMFNSLAKIINLDLYLSQIGPTKISFVSYISV